MVDIENVDLNFERTLDAEDGDFGAELNFDVTFTDAEKQDDNSYRVVGGLVEVDGPLDQYGIDEYEIFYNFGELTRVVLDEEGAEGQTDNSFGLIGIETVDASVGSDSMTFTESLGQVGRKSDGSYNITSSRYELAEGVVDYDEDSTSQKMTSEFRGMVWAYPMDQVMTERAADSEEVSFVKYNQ
ncbi:hypothetical protein EGH22_04825 [Halomicroarcula sp. F28]|uniref:hypothetical protein n=1 Tax=Haloarcula salinisoli TaxID=2487746 RepID=UPI001C739070|nr:hypothetical protein [Halomicroarcula salinisoli]MBX0285637.1 hypothetical protein [Halomicroarcula salinisoli]